MAGLIVVDHGSKVAAANQMLDQVVELMTATPGFNFQPILAAHMDLAPPTIAEAMAQIHALGIRQVFVFPYFLAPGRHSQADIPRLVKHAADALPGMQAWVTEPFGVSPKLVEAALQRIRACRDQASGVKVKLAPDGPITTKVQRRSNRTTRRMKPQI